MAQHTILAEIFYDADWHTVPTYNRDPVEITRGRQDQLQQVSPTMCTLTINNRSGTYSPRNAMSSLFGKIGPNTRLRVTIDGDVRFVGEVQSWPQRWTTGATDVWVPITALGLLQRLGMPGQKALAKSALRRFIVAQDVVAGYWPMEGYELKPETVESAIDGVANATHRPFTATSVFPLDWAGDNSLPGSLALPRLENDLTAVAGIQAKVSVAPDDAIGLAFWTRTEVPKTGATQSINTQAIQTAATGGNTSFGLTLVTYPPGSNLAATPATGGRVVRASVTVAGTLVDFVDTAEAAFVDGWHHVYCRYSTSGADVAVSLRLDGVVVTTGTLSPAALDTIKTASMNLFAQDAVNDVAGAISGGHPVLLSGSTTDLDTFAAAMYEAGLGFAGEEAHTRIERVCDEEGIAVTINGSASELMGAQWFATPLEVAQESAAVDHGILHEPRDDFGLAYRCLHTLENQAPALALTYGQKEIGWALDPIEDLDLVQNDVTVKRRGSASGRAVQETGPRNVQESTDDPEGVGRYAVEYELVLHEDGQAVQHASFLRSVGTDPGARYPVIGVDLDSLTAQGKTSLVAAAVSVDVGDRLTIASPPDFAQNDDINLMVQGYTERASLYRRTLEFNATSADPYQVGVYAEDEMTLLTAEDTTSTAWRIASEPVFTSDSADLPVSLTVDGEEVSVTAVSPIQPAILAGTPTHGDNASLSPVLPSHVEGDLIVIFAAIRNSGTGTVDSLSGQGYASLDAYGNIRVFGKYATSALMADPTVTFTGGAAGDTTSAVAIRARGCQIDVTNIKEQLNGSAADIAYPYYVVEGDVEILQFCWKQDDYTSVAAGSGLTEVVEASSTTGNDQSLYVARGPNSTDSLPIPIGSHTVTGGAAAISRVIFMTLPRGVADITVTRSVNGVETSHSQLATVQVTHPMNLAL